MKFWKSSLVAVLLLAATCCTPAVPPPAPPAPKHVDIDQLSALTVALVELPDEVDTLGGVQAYCTGVWVSSSSILTADHCTQKQPIGTRLKVVVESDVIDSLTHKELAFVNVRGAAIYDRDAAHDLAMLRVDHWANPIHPIARVTSTPVRVGQPSFNMGQSLGLWWTFGSGSVSAIRKIDTSYVDCLIVQTTTPTSPGNSGGGLFNEDGELIGLAHATILAGQSLNFYIHPKYIADFIKKQGGAI